MSNSDENHKYQKAKSPAARRGLMQWHGETPLGYSHAAAAKSAAGFDSPEFIETHDPSLGYHVRAQRHL